MLFIVGLSHVIATSAARVQVSFQLRMSMFKMSAFSFNECTKSGKSYVLFTRYSGYILQARWIHL